MCGRTCCALRAERYECATSYYDSTSDSYKKCTFDQSSRVEFKPSTNIAPTEVAPVLVWNAREKRPVLKPMVWGLIPSWADDSYSSSKYHTHNCRIESVNDSNLFKRQLTEGRRCVAVCEGYYEWQTVGPKRKSPAFIYFNQPHGMKVEEMGCWETGSWSERKGWTGPVLTFLAGLYSVSQSPLKGEVMSFTVVTMAASPAVSSLHHRMPTVLSTSQQVKDWLNYEDTDWSEAVNNLRPTDSLSWHYVSSTVNNSRNKTSQCNKPFDEMKTPNQRQLTCWFSKEPVKRNPENSPTDGCLVKKVKQ